LFRGNKTPELKEAVRLIESHGAVLEFRPRTDKQAQDWIQQWVRREGKSISAHAARDLIDRVGTKEGDLLGEMRKLMAYTGGRTAIDVEDVEEVAAGARPRKIFDFTDALAERRTSDALQILHQLLEDGTAPLAMLGMMSRQIRLIWLTRDALQKRLGKDQLTQRLAIPTFLHQRLRNQAGKWDELSLWNGLEALIRMDRALKSSGLAPELLMDHWVLCHGSASPKRGVRRDSEDLSPRASSKPSTTPSR
jgi:DNA polymerase-3 subunit delta